MVDTQYLDTLQKKKKKLSQLEVQKTNPLRKKLLLIHQYYTNQYI